MLSSEAKYEAELTKRSIEYFKDIGQAEVNEKKNNWGQLAIHVAAGCGNNIPEVKRLLSLGADINSKDNINDTPLHEAANWNRGDSHFDVIKMLLELGAEVNAQNEDGATPLHCLILKSNVKTVNLLLDFGANVNIRDNESENPLSKAISFNNQNFDVLKLLLDFGCDFKNSNNQNMTPLHHACAWSNLKLVKFLVKNGANVNSLYSRKRTPLIKVFEYLHLLPDWVKFLIKYSDFKDIDSSENRFLGFYRYKESKKEVWRIILAHVAKLQALDLPIHQKLHEIISNRLEYREFFKQCTDELLLAKTTRLQNCWVTYFNLLLDSRRKLKNYTGNEDLVEFFKNSDCLNKFYTYGYEMIKRVDKGIETRKSFDKSTVELSNCLPIFNPKHLIISDVLDCLTFKDYNRLISDL